MRGLTLQRLQVFCSVYERNSISAAARALALSQPTVSRHLRDFEAASNLTLFVLSKGRVIPTAEADALYSESHFLQDGLNRLETRMEGLRHGTGAKLSISSVNFLMPGLVAPALADLMAQMPNLRLSVDIGTAQHQLDNIRAGQTDIGIMAGRVPVQDEDVERIGKGKLVAMVPTELAAPYRTRGSISLEDIAEMPTVDTTARGPIGRILDDAMRDLSLSAKAQIMCHSLAAVPYVAQALGRAAILDAFTAQAHPLPGLIPLRLIPDLTFDILAVSAAPTGSRVATEIFIKALRQRL